MLIKSTSRDDFSYTRHASFINRLNYIRHMKNIWLLLLLPIVFSCANTAKKQAKQRQERIYNIHQQVIQSEHDLQQQMAKILELQMKDSGILINDTNNYRLQQQIDSMEICYEKMQNIIESSMDSVNKMEDIYENNSLKNASLELLQSYNKVAGNEYSVIIQLIKLPDTAYTKEKQKAYLNTSRKLNRHLDEAVEKFNKTKAEFAKQHNISPKH